MRLITDLDKKRFDAFNEEHPYGSFLQSSQWGAFKAMGEWSYELVGLEDADELVGVCMLLKRKLPAVPRYMFYASRGFVCNYGNLDVVKTFTELLKDYVKKNKGMVLKIDPCVKYQQRDAEGDLAEGPDNKKLVEDLKAMGYRHKGVTLDFDGVQPRFVYKLDLDRTPDELLKKFHHKTRYNIKVAQKKGVEIYEGTKADLKEFVRIMEVTGERDGFITRPLSYFENMYDVLYPEGKLKLYLAKYNVKQALETNMKNLEQEQRKKKPDDNRIVKLTKEIEEQKGLLDKYPEGILVSGTIMLVNGKVSCYLYGASDNLYRNIMPNYLIQWQMIKDSYEMGCEVYDFRGISGDRSPDHHLYGLYRFKKGFTGEFVEYIGEFDYVINPFFFFIYEWGLPRFKKLLLRLKR